MQENRNNCCGGSNASSSSCKTAIIDTSRVLDTCKDRDCYENTRVYLTACGEKILENSSNLRTKSAKILGAYVGLNEVPFNCGFYQVRIRYYVEIDFEACVGVGRSQTFKGLSILDKDVVLYGGEGRALSFKSGVNGAYCNPYVDTGVGNDPTAIVEAVEPVVLGTTVSECNCPCPCGGDYTDIPEGIRNSLGEEIIINSQAPRILVSFGIFSVIRIVRSAQLLINATDYSVPDKECAPGSSNDNPCDLFRPMDFPVSQFRGTDRCFELINDRNNGNGGTGCGCHGKG